MKTMKTRRHTCKRLLSVLVALAMCIGMFQSVAFAGEIPEDGNAAEENGDMAVEFLVVNTDDADDAEDTEDADASDDVDTEDAGTNETEDAEVPEDTENIEDTENAEDTEDAGDAEVPEDTENKVNTDDVETILPEEPVESEEPDDAETPDETEKPGETGSWDMKDTERPEQTPDVSVGVGPTDPLVTPSEPAEPNHPAEGKDWSIFYDKENDVYKLTFNIGEDAKGEQVIDMTYALELLNQYAQAGSAELEEEKNKVQKPEMGELPEEPKMDDIGEAPVEPEKPVAPDAPEKPEEPVEPGKPEGLDEAIDSAYNTLFDKYSNPENNGDNLVKNVLKDMESMGLDVNDQYVTDYANYIVQKADNAFLISLFESGGEGNKAMYKYFVQWHSDYNGRGEPTPEQVQKAINSVKRQDERLNVPEYQIDKNSQAYKDYEAAMDEYQTKLDKDRKSVV